MNHSFLRLIGFISLLLSLAACASRQEAREVVITGYAAPVLLPGTSSRMNTAGFWIGIHPDPDRIVIPPDEIASFNRSIRNETGMVRDLTAYPFTVRGTRASKPIRSILKFMESKRYVRQDGTRTDASFFSAIEGRMDIPSIPSHIEVRFGLVTASTAQRLLPTDAGLHSGMKSIDIDRLQNSSLDIGTPLAVLHATRDGRWLYAETPLSEGGVRSEHVGFVSRGELCTFLTRAPFFVITGAKADVFIDDTLRNHHAWVRMGCRFPSGNPGAGGAQAIVLPFREPDGTCAFRDAFIAGSDVSRVIFPTPRAPSSCRRSSSSIPPTAGAACTASKTARGSFSRYSPPRASISPATPCSRRGWAGSSPGSTATAARKSGWMCCRTTPSAGSASCTFPDTSCSSSGTPKESRTPSTT